jgi:hypothetical protein
MSDGVFDPMITLDAVGKLGNNIKEVIKPIEENISGGFPFSDIENKEYWVIGLLVLVIIGYYTYDLVLKNNETFKNMITSNSKPRPSSNKSK